jgi:hypothetical protein
MCYTGKILSVFFFCFSTKIIFGIRMCLLTLFSRSTGRVLTKKVDLPEKKHSLILEFSVPEIPKISTIFNNTYWLLISKTDEG